MRAAPAGPPSLYSYSRRGTRDSRRDYGERGGSAESADAARSARAGPTAVKYVAAVGHPPCDGGRVGAARVAGFHPGRSQLRMRAVRSTHPSLRNPLWVSLRDRTIAHKGDLVQGYRGEWGDSRGLVAGSGWRVAGVHSRLATRDDSANLPFCEPRHRVASNNSIPRSRDRRCRKAERVRPPA